MAYPKGDNQDRVRQSVGKLVIEGPGCGLLATFDSDHAVQQVTEQPRLNAQGTAHQGDWPGGAQQQDGAGDGENQAGHRNLIRRDPAVG